jgi:MtN3 and saliva related transmembrane protein
MAETALAVAAAVYGVLMGASPILQIRRMLHGRSSRDVSVGYFGILLIGFVLWISYGLAVGSLPLVVSNSVAFVVAASTVVVALWLRHGGVP